MRAFTFRGHLLPTHFYGYNCTFDFRFSFECAIQVEHDFDLAFKPGLSIQAACEAHEVVQERTKSCILGAAPSRHSIHVKSYMLVS